MRCLLVALGLIGLALPRIRRRLPEFPTLRGTETFVPAYPTYRRWDGFYSGGQLGYTSLQPISPGQRSLWSRTLRATRRPRPNESRPVAGARAQKRPLGRPWRILWATTSDGKPRSSAWELNYTHASLGAGAPSSPLARRQSIGGQINDVSIDSSGSLHVTDFATTRARLGWAAGSFMPYLTIGLAFGHADEAVATNVTDVVSDPSTTPPTVVGVFFFPNSQAKNGAYIYGFSGGGGLDSR